MSIIEDLKMQYRIGGIANKLIYWNVGVFLVSLIFFYQFKLGIFSYPHWLALSSVPSEWIIFPWTLLTYAFLHSGILHLFFNMMILHFSSRLFLIFFTQKQYIGLYFLGAIFSGIIYTLSSFLLGSTSVIVGASAAIMAILVAATTYQPLMDVRIPLIGNVKLWHITGVILLLDLMYIGIENTGGHISHLAGAFFGFLYIKLLQNGTDLSKIVSSVIDFFVNLFKPKKATPFKKVHKNYKPEPTKPTVSRVVTKDKTQQQIDEILDKISQSGYDSLTKEEKEFLFKAGK
ncbi:rhomboid family intramembrane serine protease [Flavobacterium soli]|uniref:rhomboid family intramembrane serine protease n=1 Tax=Flavobacterium soli TaxID=344881 RepID=UPI00040618C3|nr:rhomboid family intramembrane serine protease [Flavobacterium soli]